MQQSTSRRYVDSQFCMHNDIAYMQHLLYGDQLYLHPDMQSIRRTIDYRVKQKNQLEQWSTIYLGCEGLRVFACTCRHALRTSCCRLHPPE